MFSTQEFLAKLQRHGGVDRTNLFMVNFIPSSNSIESNDDLRFFCKTASLPGIDVTTAEYKPNGYGMGVQLPNGINNPGFSCIFILDSNNAVLSYMHRWAQNVMNYDTSRGNRGSANGMLPYEMGYLRGETGYGMTAIITKFNPYEMNVIYETVLTDVYPINIGSVSLTWEEQNTFSTLPVAFTYSSMSFTGSWLPTTDGNFNRGTGDLTRLESLDRKAQSINDFINNNTRV